MSSTAAAEITVTAERGAKLQPEPLSRLNNEQSVFDIEERIQQLHRNGQSLPFRLGVCRLSQRRTARLAFTSAELIAVPLPTSGTYANRG
jgi:hypothetical protein